MSDNQNRPEDQRRFQTDEVAANRAIENGQGVGARELAAQREPGDVGRAEESPLDHIAARASVDPDTQESPATGPADEKN